MIEWIDTSRIPSTPTLRERVSAVRRLAPYDLVFIHRDADNQPPAWRYEEIAEAAAGSPYVAVVPVRMTEAWLLFDEESLRAASGRPSGKEPLNLPPVRRLESLPDPKRTLKDTLLLASGTTGRRRERFDPIQARARVADLIEDWAPLRLLPAFQQLERDVHAALAHANLPTNPIAE